MIKRTRKIKGFTYGGAALFISREFLAARFIFHPGLGGQFFQRFVKRKIFNLHQKRKDIPARLTAKTIKEAFFPVTGKRGGFLLMKRTARFVGLSGPF